MRAGKGSKDGHADAATPVACPEQRDALPACGGILLLGAGFLFAYDNLRSNRVELAAAAFANDRAIDATAAPRTRPSYEGEGDYDALVELGIDPDDENLSAEAKAAIARAHRAAREAAGSAATDTMVADPALDPSGGMGLEPPPPPVDIPLEIE